MVFSTTNLFKGIQCPAGEACKLTKCIYGHEMRPQAIKSDTPVAVAQQKREATAPSDDEPDLKRSKFNTTTKMVPGKTEKAYLQDEEKITWSLKAADDAKSSVATRPKSITPLEVDGKIVPPANTQSAKESESRTISPPAPRRNPHHAADHDNQAARAEETLNPRQITSAPETHGKRAVLIRALHTEIVRLNGIIKGPVSSRNKRMTWFVLSEQELIKFALDQEEKIARQSPKVYGNVIRNCIMRYKKMGEDKWLDEVKASLRTPSLETPHKAPLKTKPPPEIKYRHMIPAFELQVLPQLVIPDQKSLTQFGYIPDPPTNVEAEEAARAVKASHDWEKCERCDRRFQVFPDRNEEGGLTSGGSCNFHPLRPVAPTKEKTDAYTGTKSKSHPCCMGNVGTEGCTTHTTHVFKTDSPARLAAVMPFIRTPENPSPAKDRAGKTVHAVTFDCEMAYTVFGFELIRLTAISWPEGSQLLDILVRPLGTVIDLNSRFSGVWPETFAEAIPYTEWSASSPAQSSPEQASEQSASLPIVDSPYKARELLCSFLKPTTPLIGHGIENDLNATRLCHPTVIDTMILYPSKWGLPYRNALRRLAKDILHWDIQTGGNRGHDSLEDALATGQLVKKKMDDVALVDMFNRGWKVEGIELLPPEGARITFGDLMLKKSLKSTSLGSHRGGELGRGGHGGSVGQSSHFFGLDGTNNGEKECEAGVERAGAEGNPMGSEGVKLSVEFLEK